MRILQCIELVRDIVLLPPTSIDSLARFQRRDSLFSEGQAVDINKLEARIAELEAHVQAFPPRRPSKADVASTNGCTFGCTGDCPEPTGDCTYGCTFGCTHGCGELRLVPLERGAK
jgi:hypothetical protein